MNSAATTALGLLAAATADYQTAWRASTRKHTDGPQSAPNADEQMRNAYHSQRVARDTLIDEGVDAELVYAIEGALVIAAARVEGERDPYFEREDVSVAFGPIAHCSKFIKRTVREGGNV